jgi:carbon monoxide dehydrogenase subunit G
MAQASYSVTIARPVETVFAFVADGERCPEWRPGVLDIKRVSGSGVGTRYRQGVAGPMGRRVAADYEVTVFDSPRRLDFQTTAGPVRPHGRYDVEAAEGGTHLTFSLDAEVKGIRRLLMGSMVQRTMDAEVRALDRAKSLLESQA